MSRLQADISDRILASIDSSGGPDACWPWLLGKDKDGYGKVKWNTRTHRPHRLILSAILGRNLERHEESCHTCDNPSCCNPTHLWLGTRKQNAEDMVAKNRQASGDRNGSRIHPERLKPPVGDSHWLRMHPERHGRKKLTIEQAEEIRRRYIPGIVTQRSVGKEFGVDNTQVSRIVRGIVRAYDSQLHSA